MAALQEGMRIRFIAQRECEVRYHVRKIVMTVQEKQEETEKPATAIEEPDIWVIIERIKTRVLTLSKHKTKELAERKRKRLMLLSKGKRVMWCMPFSPEALSPALFREARLRSRLKAAKR
jgi:hypothetical protein